MRLTPHDIAKIGFLYLHGGVWENKRVLSEKWVSEATRGHISTGGHFHYGYHWWVDEELYFGMGYQGQFIFVIPPKNMVAVFTSSLRGQTLFTPYSSF